MKNLYIFFGLMLFTFLGVAQEPRIVKVNGWDPTGSDDIESFNNVLYDAIDADSTARKTNPNVIFELTRGHYYPQGKTIQNFDFRLHIRAAAGNGMLPVITPGKQANGTYGADYIYAYNDITMENIEVNGHTPDGKVLNRMIEARGNNSRYIVKGCFYSGDRGSLIVANADSLKIYIYDSKFGNSGHRKTAGGNGRPIDLRPNALYLDTLIMQNCTNYNHTDRIIRNMGTKVNYLLFDHNTTTNNKGYHGALQLGVVNYAKVTNNIFANTISLGHVDIRTQEQTQPEKHFSVISLDTTFEGQTVIIRNNNIYTDQSIIDVWAKYDSVSAPYEITQTIKNAIGEANVSKAWFAEPLTFKTLCGAFPDYVDAWYADPTASEFPEDWCVGGEGGYFPDEIDASYGTTAISFTAADGGFPMGDLNYYPDKKAEWENWIPTAVHGFKNQGTEIKIYPNPFSERVKMVVNANKAELIEIFIFDINGKMVYQVAKQHVSQGIHEYVWDGSSANGNKVNTGVYMYKVITSTEIQTGSLVLIK